MENSESIDEQLIINSVYFEQLKDQLMCSICTCLLDSPLMCSSCETPFCGKCIKTWVKKNNSCPMRCKDVVIKDINRSLKKILDGLKLRCKYNCEVSLLEYRNHIKSCEDSRKEVGCWNCGNNCKFAEMKVKNESDFNDLKAENLKLKEIIAKYQAQLLNSDSFTDSLLNISNLELIKSWIQNSCTLDLIYKGTKDGFSASKFHQKCDNKGHTVVIMKTNFDQVIGGFTVVDWTSPSPSGLFYRDLSGKCFLFSLTLKQKYPLKSTDQFAVCSNQNYGPIFGSYDLLTVNNGNVNNCGNFDIGTCYNYSGSKNQFYGGTPYKLKEIEVYQVNY